MRTGTYRLILNRAQAMTPAEIAEDTDLSVSTVRRYLAEAIERGAVVAQPTGGRSHLFSAVGDRHPETGNLVEWWTL